MLINAAAPVKVAKQVEVLLFLEDRNGRLIPTRVPLEALEMVPDPQETQSELVAA